MVVAHQPTNTCDSVLLALRLHKAESRLHLVEGLLLAHSRLEEVVQVSINSCWVCSCDSVCMPGTLWCSAAVLLIQQLPSTYSMIMSASSYLPACCLQAIRAASDGPAAKAALVSGFGLSESQADGVLAMTLRRLTGLEAGKLREEQQQLTATIADLRVRGNSQLYCFHVGMMV